MEPKLVFKKEKVNLILVLVLDRLCCLSLSRKKILDSLLVSKIEFCCNYVIIVGIVYHHKLLLNKGYKLFPKNSGKTLDRKNVLVAPNNRWNSL